MLPAADASKPEMFRRIETKEIKEQTEPKKGTNLCSKLAFSTNWIRKLVSTNKRRLAVEGYNLDLTYITNRVIACGFPAEGLE